MGLFIALNPFPVTEVRIPNMVLIELEWLGISQVTILKQSLWLGRCCVVFGTGIESLSSLGPGCTQQHHTTWAESQVEMPPQKVIKADGMAKWRKIEQNKTKPKMTPVICLL